MTTSEQRIAIDDLATLAKQVLTLYQGAEESVLHKQLGSGAEIALVDEHVQPIRRAVGMLERRVEKLRQIAMGER